MRSLPPFATQDRVFGAVLVVGCGIAQAVALAIAAFATRDAFAALHAATSLEPGTVIALGIAGVMAALFLFVARRQSEALGQSYAMSLRAVLYEAIAHLPKSRHAERRLGALSLRFVGDLSAARLWFGRGLTDLLTASVVLPGAIVILWMLDPVLAVAGLFPLTLALVGMGALAWHLEQRHRALRRRRANIAIAMIERIAIAPDLDVMGRTDRELQILDRKSAQLKANAVARRARTVGLQAILQGGAALSGLSILWVASRHGSAPAAVAASLSVLALITLPLQELGAAWDRFCAWRVARGKAQRLLDEPALMRRATSKHAPMPVTLRGTIDGQSVAFDVQAGEAKCLPELNAKTLARLIAGLDHAPGVTLSFGAGSARPHVAYIGDEHVGLQGSLRRSASLLARKRPRDARIGEVLAAFGLGALLDHPRALDQRVSENGAGMTAAQTLRLDLARAVLGQADVIVISSIRWQADPHQTALLKRLRSQTSATLIFAQEALHPYLQHTTTERD